MLFCAVKKVLYTFVTLAMLAVLPFSIQAQEAPQISVIEFNLPAGKLGDVLNQYSRQAGVTLSFDERLVQSYTVTALTGNYRAEDVLFILLQGTSLIAVPVGEGAWLIQDKTEQELMVLDTIRVQGSEGGEKDLPYKTAASVNVISRQDIERFRGTSMGDIFQGTPGVLVSENRNSGGLDINIRGMQGQGRVPVVIDGSRQETTVYRGYSGVSSRSYIDPDLIGSMRIEKGPVMSADGTGATGGVVSVSTLRAEDVVKSGELSGLRVRVSGIGNSSSAPATGTTAGYDLPRKTYNSNCRFESVDCTPDQTKPDRFAPEHGMDRPGMLEFASYAASLAGAKRYEWGDVVLAYAKREQGNYYSGTNGDTANVNIKDITNEGFYLKTEYELDGASPFRGGERIPNTNFSSESWLLKSVAVLPDDQNLELSYIRYDSAYGEMMPSQIKSFGEPKQWLDSEVLNHTYTSRYRWQPVEYDWADVRFNLWHTNAQTDLNTPTAGSDDLDDNIHRIDDYQRWGTDISNTMRFYPKGELQWDYGLAGQWEEMDSDTPGITRNDSFYGGPRSGWRKEYSAFTAMRWQPWTQWKFEAGIRHTRFSSKDNNPLPLDASDPACVTDENGNCLPVRYKNNQAGNAPIFSVTYEPVTGLQLYYRHAEALRMPSLFENTSGFSVSPALDIPINPEHATNKELGINYLNAEVLGTHHQLRAKLAYFQNHVADYITRTHKNTWEQELDGLANLFRIRNIDSLDLHGWELNLGYDARWWIWEFSGTRYTHIEVCNVASGVRDFCNDWGLKDSYVNNMVPPTWHVSSHFGLRLLQEKLHMGIRATIVGERNKESKYGTGADWISIVDWHSYRVWDFYTDYKIDDSLSVDFTVDNMTDKYYLDALSLGLVPSPGRTAKLSLTAQF